MVVSTIAVLQALSGAITLASEVNEIITIATSVLGKAQAENREVSEEELAMVLSTTNAKHALVQDKLRAIIDADQANGG